MEASGTQNTQLTPEELASLMRTCLLFGVADGLHEPHRPIRRAPNGTKKTASFIVSYNQDVRRTECEWEHMFAEWLEPVFSRRNLRNEAKFYPDDAVPPNKQPLMAGQMSFGHMSACGNWSRCKERYLATFVTTNCVNQLTSFNNGIFNKAEQGIRDVLMQRPADSIEETREQKQTRFRSFLSVPLMNRKFAYVWIINMPVYGERSTIAKYFLKCAIFHSHSRDHEVHAVFFVVEHSDSQDQVLEPLNLKKFTERVEQLNREDGLTCRHPCPDLLYQPWIVRDLEQQDIDIIMRAVPDQDDDDGVGGDHDPGYIANLDTAELWSNIHNMMSGEMDFKRWLDKTYALQEYKCSKCQTEPSFYGCPFCRTEFLCLKCFDDPNRETAGYQGFVTWCDGCSRPVPWSHLTTPPPDSIFH